MSAIMVFKKTAVIYGCSQGPPSNPKAPSAFRVGGDIVDVLSCASKSGLSVHPEPGIVDKRLTGGEFPVGFQGLRPQDILYHFYSAP